MHKNSASSAYFLCKMANMCTCTVNILAKMTNIYTFLAIFLNECSKKVHKYSFLVHKYSSQTSTVDRHILVPRTRFLHQNYGSGSGESPYLRLFFVQTDERVFISLEGNTNRFVKLHKTTAKLTVLELENSSRTASW